jgi:serine/threonine protein kinase
MEASYKSGTLIAHRYLILTSIGEGGFGTVYKARDQQQHGKIVAVKEINMVALSAQEKIEVTDTFNREITLLSELSHKNLPNLFNSKNADEKRKGEWM